MKPVQLFLFVCLSTLMLRTSYSQPSSMVQVLFMDDKAYIATELGRTSTILKAQFVHSGAIYEFDNTGTILKSTGAYRVGDKVKCIRFNKRLNSVYGQGPSSSNYITCGVVFGDGKVYYGNVYEPTQGGQFSINFIHSGSIYIMQKEGSVWKVKSTDKGTYPPGHTLKDIFEVSLDSGQIFYCK